MSVDEAKAVMASTTLILDYVDQIKKQARRKVAVRVNTIIAQITKLVRDGVEAQVEKKIDEELGAKSRKMRELRAEGEKLEKMGQKMEQLKKEERHYNEQFMELNLEFYSLALRVKKKIKDIQESRVQFSIESDLNQVVGQVRDSVSVNLKVNEEVVVQI